MYNSAVFGLTCNILLYLLFELSNYPLMEVMHLAFLVHSCGIASWIVSEAP